MIAEALAQHLAKTVPPETLKQFRAPRAAIVLPILRFLCGSIEERRVIEFGSGEPLLLAKALQAEGARMTAVDPALSDPRVESDGVQLLAADLFELSLDALAPADVTVSTLLFGAPLRQRARRMFWPEYRRGERPSEDQVLARLREIECTFIDRLAAWTKPGGWTVHWSLERLFASTELDWRERGFELLRFDASTDVGGVLTGMVIGRRIE